MPQVPKTRQIEPKPFFSFQNIGGASPEAFGSETGKALSQFGQQLGQLSDVLAEEIIKQNIEDNERAAKDAENKYYHLNRLTDFGDGTEENPGFYGLKGENAIRAYDGVLNQRDQNRQKAREGLSDQARDMFDTAIIPRDRVDLDDYSRHLLTQRQAANELASTSRIANAASEAADKYTNPEILNRSLMITQAEVQALGEQFGWDDATFEHNLRVHQSTTIEGVVEAALANDNILVASETLKANRDKMDGTVFQKLVDKVRDEAVVTMAQAAADAAILKFPKDPLAQQEYVQQITEGKVRDRAVEQIRSNIGFILSLESADRARESFTLSLESAARAELNHRQSQEDRAVRDQQLDLTVKVTDWLNEGKNLFDFPEYDLLSASNRAWALSYRSSLDDDIGVETDYAFMYSLLRTSPSEFAKLDLKGVKDHISKADFNRYIMPMWVAANTPDDPESVKVFTPNQIFTNEANAAGFVGDEFAQPLGRVWTFFIQDVNQFVEKEGRRPTDSEMQTMARNLFKEHDIPATVLGFRSSLFGTRSTSIAEHVVPFDRAAENSQVLIQFGIQPTDSLVVLYDLYRLQAGDDTIEELTSQENINAFTGFVLKSVGGP